jgi:tRNA pseudouridine55 synthase
VHGVIVVDKPGGMTSAHVVSRARRALSEKAIGHTGTLDPMATGVLPLCIGEATKLAGWLLAEDKSYEGELELGIATDTYDIEGKVLTRREAAAAAVDEAALRAGMAQLTGTLDQVPPMYSAIKQQGRRLFELARAGEEVERAPRRVHVARFALTSFTPPRARFAVDCEKGTYVRSLVRDLGEALGCGATLTALRRTRAGRFTLAAAVPIEELAAQLGARLVRPPDAIAHLASVGLDAAGMLEVRCGRPLPAPPEIAEGTVVRLLTPDGELAAVATRAGDRLVTARVFNYALRF